MSRKSRRLDHRRRQDPSLAKKSPSMRTKVPCLTMRNIDESVFVFKFNVQMMYRFTCHFREIRAWRLLSPTLRPLQGD